MRWLVLFITLMFVGCQPSYSDKEIMITPKSCEVAVQLAKRSLVMFREGRDQFDVMVMLDNYNTQNNSDAFAGKVYTQVMVVDFQKNVYKAFKDQDILSVFTKSCTNRLGFKIPKGK